MSSIPTVPSATPAEIYRRLQNGDDLLLVDVREVNEVAIASLPDALICPMSRAADWIDHLPPGPLVIFCHHGVRSMHVAAALMERGRDNVINMTGGIELWSTQVDPAVPRY